MKGYCTLCGRIVDIIDAKLVMVAKTRPCQKGTCSICGQKMLSFIVATGEQLVSIKKTIKKQNILVDGWVRKDQLALRYKNKQARKKVSNKSLGSLKPERN